MVEGIR